MDIKVTDNEASYTEVFKISWESSSNFAHFLNNNSKIYFRECTQCNLHNLVDICLVIKYWHIHSHTLDITQNSIIGGSLFQNSFKGKVSCYFKFGTV